MPLRLAHRIEWDLCISLRDLTTIHTPRQAPRWPDRSAGLGRNGTSLTPPPSGPIRSGGTTATTPSI